MLRLPTRAAVATVPSLVAVTVKVAAVAVSDTPAPAAAVIATVTASVAVDVTVTANVTAGAAVDSAIAVVPVDVTSTVTVNVVTVQRGQTPVNCDKIVFFFVFTSLSAPLSLTLQVWLALVCYLCDAVACFSPSICFLSKTLL